METRRQRWSSVRGEQKPEVRFVPQRTIEITSGTHGGGGRGMENCATQRGARKRVRQEKSNARLNRRFPLPSTPPPPRFQWSLRKRAHPRHKCGFASSTGRLHPPSPSAATTAAWRATGTYAAASFVAGFREIAL